jgi:hypothetical protein
MLSTAVSKRTDAASQPIRRLRLSRRTREVVPSCPRSATHQNSMVEKPYKAPFRFILSFLSVIGYANRSAT